MLDFLCFSTPSCVSSKVFSSQKQKQVSSFPSHKRKLDIEATFSLGGGESKIARDKSRRFRGRFHNTYSPPPAFDPSPKTLYELASLATTIELLSHNPTCVAQSMASCCISSDMSAFLITALRSVIFARFLLLPPGVVGRRFYASLARSHSGTSFLPWFSKLPELLF